MPALPCMADMQAVGGGHLDSVLGELCWAAEGGDVLGQQDILGLSWCCTHPLQLSQGEGEVGVDPVECRG